MTVTMMNFAFEEEENGEEGQGKEEANFPRLLECRRG
jgi:hypothetical protein